MTIYGVGTGPVARHYTISIALRMAARQLLEEFFVSVGHPLGDVDWERVDGRNIKPVLTAISQLSPAAQDHINSVLSSIFELACETGWRSIQEVRRAVENINPLDSFPDDACIFERTLATWLRYPELFAQAALLHQVEGLASWQACSGLPRVPARKTRAALRELSKAVSDCLWHEERRGQACSVEYVRRSNLTDVFVAYPEDFVEVIFSHDRWGRLVPHTVHQAFQIVFAYNASLGTLELFAGVAPHVRDELESLFCQTILGIRATSLLHQHTYDLNRFKDKSLCLDTDPADHLSASIRRLCIKVAGHGRLTIEPVCHRLNCNVYDVLEDCINKRTICWEDAVVQSARIQLEFEPLGRHRLRPLTFDISCPAHCRVRSHRPDQIELARKYLHRWRIAHA